MKARTLPAVDAALIATRVKTIIVTDNPVPAELIGQTIAIHADDQTVTTRTELGDWEAWPADTADQPHPNHPNGRPARLYCNARPATLSIAQWYPLPSDEIIATATITDCLPIFSADTCPGPPALGRARHICIGPFHIEGEEPDPTARLLHVTHMHDIARNITDQMAYGDYQPGRWGVLLGDVAAVTRRQPAGTAQGRPEWWGCEL